MSGTTIYIEASAGSGYNASITVDGNPFNSGNTKVITADTTVVSSATQNQFTITLDNQSASIAGTPSLTEKYGDGVYIGTLKMTTSNYPINRPSKTGYAFGGYYTLINGNGIQMIDDRGYITSNFTSTYFNSSGTLYAKWTENTYGVHLVPTLATTAGTDFIYETYGVKYSLTSDGNAMTPSSNPIEKPKREYEVTYNYNGATGGNSEASKKAEYTFKGYYKYSNGGGTQYIGANGYLTSSAGNTDFTSNGSIYADWTPTSITLPTPTKTGYAFGGWYSDSSLTTFVGTEGASYTPEEDITLYAKWTENTFVITLDNANATENGTSTIYENYGDGVYLESSLTNKMTTSTNPITKPKREYTVTYNYNGSGQANGSGTAAYGFNGYYDGTTQMINGEGKITNNFTSTKYTEAQTLNAKWTDGNVILPTPNTRTGFTFEGWYKEASLANKVGNAGDSYIPTTNITLYAKWIDSEKPVVTITRTDYNTFTWTASDSIGVTGYQITTSSTRPSATGSGWITGGTLTSGTYDISNAGTYYVWAKDASGNVSDAKSIKAYTLTRTQGANTTLTIKENNSSGTTFSNNTTAVLDGTTIYVEASVDDGYTLGLTVGGNDFTSGNTTQITANTEVESFAKASIYTITLDNADATIPGTSKIYEKYGDGIYSESGLINKMTTSTNSIVIPQRKYIVTFDYNGSGQETGNATAEYGFDGYYDGTTKMIEENGYITSEFTTTKYLSSQTLHAKWTDGSVTLPTPNAREGYTFGGWYKDVACTDANKIGDEGDLYVPTEDVTLYGKWEINQYTLTVNPYGDTYTQDYRTTIEVEVPEVKITLKFEDGITDDEEITAIFKEWGLTGGMPSGGINSQTSNPVTYTYGASDAVLTAYYNRITMQKPTRAGYTFDGWYTERNGGQKEADGNDQYEPTETKTLYAHWTANRDTLYKIEHYLQKPNGTYSNYPYLIEDKLGTTDTEVTAVPREFQGYTEDEENENRIASGNVNGDGSLVLKLYYLANTDTPYTVEYYFQNVDNDEEYTINEDETEHKEGITGDLTAAETKVYLGFIAKDFEQKRIRGDGSTLIKIYYDRCLDTPYTVRHYLQNVDNDEEYTIDNNATEQKSGRTGNLTEAEAKEYPGFTAKEITQTRILGDGSSVVDVLYDRNTDTQYKVEYYLQNVEDDEYTQDEEATEEKEGKTGALTEAEEKEYEGFEVKVLEQEEINGDGSTVVKVYYDRELKTVTFKNYDGVTLETKTVKYEGNVEYTGGTPEKDKAGYTCTFIGWNRDLENITEDTEIIAEYSEEVIVYTIEYKQVSIEGVEFERENPTTYTVETEDFTLCNPTAAGFTFVGWRLEGQNNVEEEVTIQKGSIGNRVYETVWQANNDTPYRVEYYKQKEDGTYSEKPEEVDNKIGTTLEKVNAEEKEYEGYELDKEKSTTEGIIKGDGSLVLKLYYKKIPEKTEEQKEDSSKEQTKEVPTENKKSSNIVTKKYTANTDNTVVEKIIPKTGTINILIVALTAIVSALGVVLFVKKRK